MEPLGGSRVSIGRPPPTAWLIDAVVYAISTIFAGATAAWAAIPLQRSWGRVAVWCYGLAAVVALAAAWLPGNAAQQRRSRTILVAAVFAAAAIAPMSVAAVRRAGGDPGDHAQSEVIVVEEAATALLQGRDPYVAEYRDGPLADRPVATQVHFPYLPGMLTFGLPRAIAGHAPWTDARVWFTVVAFTAAGFGLIRMRASSASKLRTFQVLFALPTGALLLATGGVDIPVVALFLATCVLVRNERPVAAGVVGGLALAVKQTSILFLPFLVLAVARGLPRRRFLLTTGAIGAAVVVPFALWDPGAFVEDVILFPLNLGQGQSAAATPTIGSLLLELVPTQRTAMTVLLVTVVAGVTTLLLFRRRGATVSQACVRAAAAFLTAIALAPAGRAGYLVYPANLLVWAIAFRGAEPHGAIIGEPEREKDPIDT